MLGELRSQLAQHHLGFQHLAHHILGLFAGDVQALQQFVGRQVDHLDLGAVEHAVRHRFAHANLGEARDDVVEALQVLEVDGGVGLANIREVAAAGADTFVAGSAIFNAPDYKAVIAEMRAQLAQV